MLDLSIVFLLLLATPVAFQCGCACTYVVPSGVAAALHELGIFFGALKAVERDVHADVTYYTKFVVIYFLMSTFVPNIFRVSMLFVVSVGET